MFAVLGFSQGNICLAFRGLRRYVGTALQHLLNRSWEPGTRFLLQEKRSSACAKRLAHNKRIWIHRYEDQFYPGSYLFEFSGGVQSIQLGHRNIGYDDVRL